MRRSPRLTDLPSPPPGRSGWPWTDESVPVAETLPDGRAWPRVTVVTPTYNRAGLLEETIRSVLLQGYPDLEYFVVDGGSTDGSVELIKRYETWLAGWVSERDRGQSDAINKGWARATGDIVAWLNSDDYYTPGAVGRAASALMAHHGAVLVYSDLENLREETGERWVDGYGPRGPLSVITERPIPQPTVFLRRDVVRTLGGVDETLHYEMDHDLFVRAMAYGSFAYLAGEVLAVFRHHRDAKCHDYPLRFAQDHETVLARVEQLEGSRPGVREAVRKARGEFYFACAVSAVFRERRLREGIGWLWRAVVVDPRYLLRLPRGIRRVIGGALRSGPHPAPATGGSDGPR
jgi:glycosyltransferase involved in cell wall biosynthesis